MNIRGKKLLILGANPETASLVQKANSMGVYTIVTDYDPGAYAKKFASKSYNIDAIDISALVDLAGKEKIDGVMVGVSEALMMTYCQLCQILGFPCYGTEEQFRVLTDKSNFKKKCREFNVSVVPEYAISDSSLDVDLSEVEFPVIVKPVDSCSSKGISVCHDRKTLESGIRKALTFSNGKKVIVEKYMTGDEVIVYYTFQNGNPIFTAMCDRYTNNEQKGVAQLPVSYIYPSRYIEEYKRKSDEHVKKMFKGLGLKHGTIFVQSFVEDGEVRFYEAGFRLNGAQEHIIVSAVNGIDVKEMMVNFALTGQMSDIDIEALSRPDFKGWGCKLSPIVSEGKIARLSGLKKCLEIPEVISVNPSYYQGDTVTGIGTLKQIIARFFIITQDLFRMVDVIDTIHRNLEVLDEHGNSMMLQPFDTDILKYNY